MEWFGRCLPVGGFTYPAHVWVGKITHLMVEEMSGKRRPAERACCGYAEV